MQKPERKTRVAVTRITEKEFHELLKAAEHFDMSFSEFLRQAALSMARSGYKS